MEIEHDNTFMEQKPHYGPEALQNVRGTLPGWIKTSPNHILKTHRQFPSFLTPRSSHINQSCLFQTVMSLLVADIINSPSHEKPTQ